MKLKLCWEFTKHLMIISSDPPYNPIGWGGGGGGGMPSSHFTDENNEGKIRISVITPEVGRRGEGISNR